MSSAPGGVPSPTPTSRWTKPRTRTTHDCPTCSPPGVRKLTYTYDRGAGWGHEIVLDKLVPAPPGQPTPRCVAFAGGSPLEYPVLEDEDGNPMAGPVVTRPFDLKRVNAILTSGRYNVDGWDHEDDAEDQPDEPDEPDHLPG